MVLGVTERHFLQALRRDGLSFADVPQESRELRTVRAIMELLRRELETISALDGAVSAKARLDALALIARTIDQVTTLQDRFAAERARGAGGLSAGELRVVLKRIDERIDELADSRARELVRIQSQPAGSAGGAPGMDGAGKDGAAAAGK
ncbi:MAG: hypothetical protein ACREIP_06905 [Alphaproteobacteria bacterium]